jgi:hypothetical protein
LRGGGSQGPPALRGIPVLHGDRAGLVFEKALRADLLADGFEPAPGPDDELFVRVLFPSDPDALISVLSAPYEWLPASALREPGAGS